MMTTNLFTHPVFKDGGVHQQRPRRAPLRAAQGAAQPRPGRRAGRVDLRVLGRPRGRRGRLRPRTSGPRSTATARASTCSPRYVKEQGYGIRFAIEPKPNEPRGDILLPTVGHALAFIAELEHGDIVGVNPEVGHEQMAGLNYTAGIAQALWAGKLFHIDLNGQRGDQVRPGPRLRPRRPAQRVLAGRPAGERRRRRPAYDGPAALRLQAAAHRGHRRACGRRPRRTCAPTCCSRSARRRSGPTPRWPRRSPPPGVADLATPDAERRARPSPTCSPTAARSRTSTPTRPASAATASCGWTSWRSST